jgi:Protein of unknown function (DUF2845)
MGDSERSIVMRRARLLGVLLGIVLFKGAPVPAHASDDGLRCGMRLVTLGDRTLEVVEKCGQPKSRSSRYEEHPRSDGGRDFVYVEEWLYRLDEGSFPRLLTFENGMLTSIRALSR